MQTAENLWEVLYQDLKSQSTQLSKDERQRALQKFKETARQIFCDDQARLGEVLEIAGDTCQESSDLEDAVENFTESLALHLKASNMADAARVTAKLALLLDHLEKKTEAERYYIQALELYAATHDHSRDCLLAGNLATLEKQMGNFDACKRYYQQALDSALQLHGTTHPDVALICNNLGVAYSEAGDSINAENHHLRALSIREQLFGALHPDVAESLANLAITYHTSAHFKKARTYYDAAIATYLVFKNNDAPELDALRANLAQLESHSK